MDEKRRIGGDEARQEDRQGETRVDVSHLCRVPHSDHFDASGQQPLDKVVNGSVGVGASQDCAHGPPPPWVV